MTELTALWLPILLSAVIVFFASFLMHMVLPHHKTDFKGVPDEDGFLEWLRAHAVPPGAYVFPHCKDFKEMKNPEVKARMERGPQGLMFVWKGMPPMAANLVMTFIFYLVVGVFVAYIAGEARAPGAEYLTVFQVAGCTAVAVYCLGFISHDIWYKRPLANTIKDVIDGIVYGLLTAGTFAWLWPEAAAAAGS